MGQLRLNQAMSMQRDALRQEIQAHNGPAGSTTIERKDSPCEQSGSSQGGEIQYPGLHLPEDIWCRIHSLLPMKDGARAACVSRPFLRSWRGRPNLTFSLKALGMNKTMCGDAELARNFTSKVDHILNNRSCTGVKTLEIVLHSYDSKLYNVDSWLQTAVTPGIEELTVQLSAESGINYLSYKFPWSLLAYGSGNSIRNLNLSWCVLSPTVGLGLRSMTGLDLCYVRITDEQLGCLLHNCSALFQMQLSHCSPLTFLKIPFHLQQLRHLEVLDCTSLKVIEREAPNLSNFHFSRYCLIQISLGVALELKKLTMSCPGAVCYARADLPSSLPNIEALSLSSVNEKVNTPMLPSKFLHLKYLNIDLAAMTFSPAYDYCSLISFLDASPSLETFILNVLQTNMEHESVVGDTSNLRQMPGYHHENLKTAEIIGFSSAKSLVELTCHIIENTASLECLTLDTTRGHNPWGRCSSNKSGMCSPMRMYMPGARKGLLAIKTYIEPKIPSRIKLTVVEPCDRCHDLELAGRW